MSDDVATPPRASSTLRSAASLFATSTAVSAATLVIYVVTARFLTRTAYGDVQALVAIATIGTIPGSVTATVLAQRVAALNALSVPLAPLVRRSMLVAWSSLPIIIGLGAILRVPLALGLHIEDPSSVPLAAWFLAAYIVLFVARGLLQGEQRFGRLASSYGEETGIRLMLTIPAAAIAGESGFFAGIGAALTVVAARDTRDLLARHARARRSSDAAPAHTGWMQSAAAMFAITVLSYYDVVLVKQWFAPELAGLYASAAVVGRMALAAVQFVPQILLPRVVVAAAQRRSASRILGIAALASAVPLGTALAAVAVAPNMVLMLVAGRRFIDAAPLLLPLTAAAAAFAFAMIGVTYLIGRQSFAVLPALLTAGAAEIVTVTLYHQTTATVAAIILGGHLALFAIVVIGVAQSGTGRPVAAASCDRYGERSGTIPSEEPSPEH